MNIRQRLEELENKFAKISKHSHYWVTEDDYNFWVEKTGGCSCKEPHFYLFKSRKFFDEIQSGKHTFNYKEPINA